MTETITYHNRTMTFKDDGALSLTHGEGFVAAKHFNIKPGEVFFDVGASDAMWTLYGLASGAFVYSFEPSVPHYKKLVEEVLLNDGFFERSKLHNLGLDKSDCVKTLETWYADMGGHAGLEITPDCTVPVRFLPMDHFLPELNRLDWVKIDVEAGELFVIQGGLATIKEFHPSFIIEDHENVPRMGEWMRANKVREQIYGTLKGLGYGFFYEPHGDRGFIIANPK